MSNYKLLQCVIRISATMITNQLHTHFDGVKLSRYSKISNRIRSTFPNDMTGSLSHHMPWQGHGASPDFCAGSMKWVWWSFLFSTCAFATCVIRGDTREFVSVVCRFYLRSMRLKATGSPMELGEGGRGRSCCHHTEKIRDGEVEGRCLFRLHSGRLITSG